MFRTNVTGRALLCLVGFGWLGPVTVLASRDTRTALGG